MHSYAWSLSACWLNWSGESNIKLHDIAAKPPMMHKQFVCFSIWSRYIRYQRCLALQYRTSHASAPATPVKNQCVKPVSACVKQNKINTSLETNILNMSTYCTIFKHRLPSRLPCDLFSLKQSGRDLWNQWNHKNSDDPGKPTHPSHWQ